MQTRPTNPNGRLGYVLGFDVPLAPRHLAYQGGGGGVSPDRLWQLQHNQGPTALAARCALANLQSGDLYPIGPLVHDRCKGVRMAGIASIVTAFAALISALAWPILLAAVVIHFRKAISAGLDRVPEMMSRAHKAKLGWLEIELRQVADIANASPKDKGVVSPEQIRSAAKVEVFSQDLSLGDLRYQVEKLCIEYEDIRRKLPSGQKRTQAMDAVLAQMRTIGPSISFMLDDLKRSSRAADRLVAVAIMQMELSRADPNWLLLRFSEDVPFIFYHASLILENLVRTISGEDKVELIDVAQNALEIVEGFEGAPDSATVNVLNSIIADVF